MHRFLKQYFLRSIRHFSCHYQYHNVNAYRASTSRGVLCVQPLKEIFQCLFVMALIYGLSGCLSMADGLVQFVFLQILRFYRGWGVNAYHQSVNHSLTVLTHQNQNLLMLQTAFALVRLNLKLMELITTATDKMLTLFVN